MSRAVTPRMERVLAAMAQHHVDTLLLTPSSSLKYVLGGRPIVDERLFVLAMTPGEEPFLLCNELYALEAEELFAGDKIFWKDGEDPYPILKRELQRRDWPLNRVAVDQSTQARFLFPMMATLDGSQFLSATAILDALRVYKDPEERDRMRQACRLGLAEPGACVCSGANAADPHYTGGNAPIQANACLLVDFGGTWKDYYTDMTRTFWFGEPDPEFVKVHNIVRQANAAAAEAAQLGRELQEVDRAARKVITNAGYGKHFIHRTGHGVGIDVHETPNAAEGETAILKPGMAFSIEPGIYLPGRFGVRIEDLALMTEDGVEILTVIPGSWSATDRFLCDKR